MHVSEKIFYADVAVIGGGSAGCSAAISSARAGLDTILLEQQTTLGGMATNGYVSGLAGVLEGNAKEFNDKMNAKGLTKQTPLCPIFDAEKAKLVLESMVIGAGVRILYDITVYDVVTENNMIKEVLAYCRGTRIIVRAEYFIDGSGDANVAAMAGAPVAHGNGEFSGYSSASSLHSRVVHVNFSKWQAACDEWIAKQIADGIPENSRTSLMYEQIKKALANGDMPKNLAAYMRGGGGRLVPGLDPDIEHDRTVLWILHAYNCRNTDVEDLTRQLLEQHVQITKSEEFFNKYCAGWEHAKIVSIANMNGLRDSRRIIGEYVFSGEDLAAQRKFEDSIARFDDMFDLHHPVTPGLVMRHSHVRKPGEGTGFYREAQCDCDMHPFGRPEGYEARTNPKAWCEVPYRTIVPKIIDNLFVVGRCFSADFNALGGIRLVATCMSTGQAAGVAARLCKKNHVIPRKLNGKEVHDYLVHEEGVPLETVYGRLAERERMSGEAFVSPADSIKYK
jgi:hypothetical protein